MEGTKRIESQRTKETDKKKNDPRMHYINPFHTLKKYPGKLSFTQKIKI